MTDLPTLRIAALIALSASPAYADLSRDAIEAAAYEGGTLTDGQSALTVKLQVLLDRADISPGVIDGYRGGMSESAIRAFEVREGFEADGVLDEQVWAALADYNTGNITGEYTITEDDVAVISPPLPEDYAELAELQWLGYERVSELVAERFHMDEDFLVAMNPGAGFVAGEVLTVIQSSEPAQASVADIEIHKPSGRLIARDAEGAMVANYPVAIGSGQNPSPSGNHEVTAVAIEPTYSYNPDINFKQGDNDQPLTLPPGPNGPVGLVWIDLSKPTYGIHGTPRPARLFSEQSHGCVRMTNWDAQELAGMVSAGTSVTFTE